MSHKQAKILNVAVSSTSTRRVLALVRERIAKKAKFYIVTPNPEIILAAQKDKGLRKILNSADLALADGYGLVWAAKILGLSEPSKVIRGREMFVDLIKLANKKSWRVFLLGGEGNIAAKTKEKLARSFKKVSIEFAEGPIVDREGVPVLKRDREIQKLVVRHINKFQPHLLFVAYGAPKQEKWIDRNMSKLDIGGAMVVGGAFDYYAGKVELPPVWMENAHLEWLWRLITQPWRMGRIVKAVIVFPLAVIRAGLVRS